jgi:tetratricopeptide (TPR) repeat protein
VTGYRAVCPGQAGSAGPEGDRPRDARLAVIAEALESAAGPLLIGASVYREPADRNALLFQVGRHDWAAAWTPDRQCPVPPYQAPPDLAALVAECAASGLLTIGAGTEPGSVFVERVVASELRRLLEAANRSPDLAAAHRRAAGYWRWRAAAWPQERRADVHDLLEARHHLRQAGETAQACELTEALCSQLHAWGELDREAALIGDTLAWLRGGSAQRAALVHKLGAIAQVRADHAEAERRYQQALDLYAAAGDLAGVARSHHSLGVLAQAQGEYARAELRYQKSADLAARPADLAARPADLAARPADLTPDPTVPAPHPADLAPRPAAPAPWAAPAPPPSSGAVGLEPAAITAEPAAAPPQPAAPPPPQPQPADAPAQPQPAATPPQSQPADAPAQPQPAATADRAARWRMAGLAGLIAALLALSAVDVAGLVGPAGRANRPARRATAGAEAVTAARQQAATWVAGQISRSAIVACDPAMCAELQVRGFPAGDMLMLGPGAPDPLASDVVVATAAVRSQYGGRLAGVYAPFVLAAFGRGGAAIEVRAVAPDGAAAFRAALANDQAARRQAGAELLRNPGLTAPAAAGRQLSDGLVDSRLLITLAALAGLRSATQPPVRIVSFGGRAPGASAQVPLRSVEIAGPAATSAIAFLRAQRSPYRAASIVTTRLPGGQVTVRIGFASPTPLGLLSNVYPSAEAGPPP